MRHRSTALPSGNDDSSSSEDDAFSALSRKKKISAPSTSKYLVSSSNSSTTVANGVVADDSTSKTTNTDTSSNKRHHHQSTQRKSKMDALLQELQETPISGPVSHKPIKAPPEKIGSYCLPGEEASTTNIFVGNLSPLTTEEQLSDIFRQFGDLYSVKIMWPRTPEEQSRGRNTGFVCFMNRSDAQDAMDALQDSDPLNSGRKMFLNWGKNVKKVVKRGAGGVPIPPIRGIKNSTRDASSQEGFGLNSHSDMENGNNVFKNHDGNNQVSDHMLEEIMYDPEIHGACAVRVVPPSDPSRFKFISTVAMFVAKDGSVLENRLIEKEANNPTFSFLMDQEEQQSECSIAEVARNERIFYRWRVFSFSQGDTYGCWRTDPFIMVKPGGNFWIPPDRDPELLAQSQKDEERNEEHLQLIKQQRRNMIAARRGYRPVGNDIQNSNLKSSSDGSVMLSSDLVARWEQMIQNLCCSREAICEAMAFCFDNSIAAQHICKLLKHILLDNRPGVSIETKCARLYLLSDVLFNSQQPGVKNAFRYRDAIEEMAPEVFKTLGQHGNGTAGRLAINKLRIAVRNVLNAWNSWSVYSDIFLDRLEALFEGKSIVEYEESKEHSDVSIPPPQNPDSNDHPAGPSSIWMECSNIAPQPSLKQGQANEEKNVNLAEMDGESCNDDEIDPSSLIDEELDGESLGDSELEEDFDVTSLEFKEHSDQ